MWNPWLCRPDGVCNMHMRTYTLTQVDVVVLGSITLCAEFVKKHIGYSCFLPSTPSQLCLRWDLECCGWYGTTSLVKLGLWACPCHVAGSHLFSAHSLWGRRYSATLLMGVSRLFMHWLLSCFLESCLAFHYLLELCPPLGCTPALWDPNKELCAELHSSSHCSIKKNGWESGNSSRLCISSFFSLKCKSNYSVALCDSYISFGHDFLFLIGKHSEEEEDVWRIP